MKTGALKLSAPYKTYNQSFLGSKFFLSKESIGQETLDYENSQAKKARDGGVNVPKYKIKGENPHIDHLRYETKGDIADVQTNPLRVKHLRSLFKNFYYMDRAGIFHKNLGSKHIFLQQDGQVELDSFRDTVNFYQRYDGTISQKGEDIDLPNFIMPSNEDTFKDGYLSEHVSSLSEEDKKFFVKNFLFYSSEYHEKRAELLANRGMNPRSIEHEIILSEVYTSPSRRLLSFEIDKLQMAKQQRDALKEWEKGTPETEAETGKKADPKRRFNSVLIYLQCIESLINLKDVAEYFSEHSLSENEKRYFDYEKMRAEKRLQKMFSDTKNMGTATFFDPENKLSLGDNDEKEFFLALCKEVDLADSKMAEAAIQDIKEYYEELKNRWDEDLNKQLLAEYQTA